MLNKHYPFFAESLPYSYSALEPYIDERTMYLHHDKHYQTYVDNLNKALKDYPAYHSWDLKALLSQLDSLPKEIRTQVRNNGGGVYNHELYFDCMGRDHPNPSMEFTRILSDAFGSLNGFLSKLKETALGRFGSGWGMLIFEINLGLRIISTPNQDVPDLTRCTPILPVDVWEHAYYLKYQNLRANYLDSWTKVIDWQIVERNYSLAVNFD